MRRTDQTSERTESEHSTGVTFRIGDVFPATDPVARYVTGIAMIANDWGRLFRLQEALGDREIGARLLLYRLQLSLHVEATKFLSKTEGQYHDRIHQFLASLPEEATSLHRELRDQGSLDRLRAQAVRDQSFHYPIVRRDRFDRGIEEMANLLTAAQDIRGSAEASGEPDFLEYSFADEVMVQLLPANDEQMTDVDAVAAFRDRALAFRRFAELAINQYVDGRPSDDLTPSEDPQ